MIGNRTIQNPIAKGEISVVNEQVMNKQVGGL